jgi:hypothetical protein
MVVHTARPYQLLALGRDKRLMCEDCFAPQAAITRHCITLSSHLAERESPRVSQKFAENRHFSLQRQERSYTRSCRKKTPSSANSQNEPRVKAS